MILAQKALLDQDDRLVTLRVVRNADASIAVDILDTHSHLAPPDIFMTHVRIAVALAEDLIVGRISDSGALRRGNSLRNPMLPDLDPRLHSHELLSPTAGLLNDIGIVLEALGPDGLVRRGGVSGQSDAWNQLQASMSLRIAGLDSEANLALDYLVEHQRSDGFWAAKLGSSASKDVASVVFAGFAAHFAFAIWHGYLLNRSAEFVMRYWPTLENAIYAALSLQEPAGEILFAKHEDGTSFPFATRGSSAAVYRGLEAAVNLGNEVHCANPGWELSKLMLGDALRNREQDGFAPKSRFAMDLYYYLLGGVLSKKECVERLHSRPDLVVGNQVRHARTDWVTSVDTAYLALAFHESGDSVGAARLFDGVEEFRSSRGGYVAAARADDEASREGDPDPFSTATVIVTQDCFRRATAASSIYAIPETIGSSVEFDRWR